MSKIEFNEKELQFMGEYPKEGTYYGYPYDTIKRLNTPISVAENYKRFYRGEDFEWVPNRLTDVLDITPHCNKDVDACDFEGGYDTFGVKWIPVEGNEELPSFVEPGFIVLDDIANWRNLEWPDVEAWPWKEYADKYNKAYKDDDRIKNGVILSGYFERLIAMMSFEEAAVALIEDPEEVSAFFEKLTDLNIKIADHYIDDFGCESILIHDDWSAQRSPFFSLETCMEVIEPHLKRLVDHVHEKGVLFTLHSCGNGEKLIPAMKAAGVDGWQAQIAAIDMDSTYEAIDGAFIFEAHSMDIPDDLVGKDLEDYLYKVLKKYNIPHRSCIGCYNYNLERTDEFRKAMYKVGRALAKEL